MINLCLSKCPKGQYTFSIPKFPNFQLVQRHCNRVDDEMDHDVRGGFDFSFLRLFNY